MDIFSFPLTGMKINANFQNYLLLLNRTSHYYQYNSFIIYQAPARKFYFPKKGYLKKKMTDFSQNNLIEKTAQIYLSTNNMNLQI